MNLNQFDAAYSDGTLNRFCFRCRTIRHHRKVKYQYSRCLACETCGKEREHKALLLDEFDRVGTTDFVKERLYRVMDGRYQGALDEKSLTIMVSNSPPNVLDRYLQDRIEEFQVFEVRTPSSLRL